MTYAFIFNEKLCERGYKSVMAGSLEYTSHLIFGMISPAKKMTQHPLIHPIINKSCD